MRHQEAGLLAGGGRNVVLEGTQGHNQLAGAPGWGTCSEHPGPLAMPMERLLFPVMPLLGQWLAEHGSPQYCLWQLWGKTG